MKRDCPVQERLLLLSYRKKDLWFAASIPIFCVVSYVLPLCVESELDPEGELLMLQLLLHI